MMVLPDVPLTTFRFEVVIDVENAPGGLTSPLCRGAFAEVDGLEMSMQHKTMEIGGVNDRQVHLIGPVTYGNLSLKRGMTDSLQLWEWFALASRPGATHTATTDVTMLSSSGAPTLRFKLTGCLPTKLRAPALSARDGLVAVEELTLVYEQLTLSPAGASLGASIGVSASVGLTASASASFSASASASFGGGL